MPSPKSSNHPVPPSAITHCIPSSHCIPVYPGLPRFTLQHTVAVTYRLLCFLELHPDTLIETGFRSCPPPTFGIFHSTPFASAFSLIPPETTSHAPSLTRQLLTIPSYSTLSTSNNVSAYYLPPSSLCLLCLFPLPNYYSGLRERPLHRPSPALRP